MAAVTNENPLADYFGVLWRRKVIFVLAVLVVTATAFLLSNRQTRIYSSTAQVLLNGDGTDDSAVETDRRVLESQSVRQIAAKTVPNLAGVSADRAPGSRIILATSDSPDPKIAADSANAYVQAFIDYSRQQQETAIQESTAQAQAKLAELKPQLDQANLDYQNGQQAILDQYAPAAKESPGEKADRETQRNLALGNLNSTLGPQRDALNTQVLLLNSQLIDLAVKSQAAQSFATIVTSASPSSSPIKPKPTRDTGVGLALGLLLGAGLAFGFDLIEDTIKSRFDVERAVGGDPSVIAAVPAAPRRKGSESTLYSLSEPFSPAAEAYRSLRTSVQFLGLETALQTVSVTSPSVGDGKTTTISNLAVVTARTGKRVVLVDADLRRPQLHNHFNLRNDLGLTSVMIGDCTLQEALQEVPDVPRLVVLTSGPLPPNPSELLSVRRFPEIVDVLGEVADLVFIDSPPLLPVTDPAIIAAHVDGVIVVVSEGSTTRRQLRQAMSTLRQVDAKAVGIVLNNSESDAGGDYGYYHRRGSVYGQAPSKRRGLFRRRKSQPPPPPPDRPTPPPPASAGPPPAGPDEPPTNGTNGPRTRAAAKGRT
jgi:capsular exopolysaccharide synthesis family protein